MWACTYGIDLWIPPKFVDRLTAKLVDSSPAKLVNRLTAKLMNRLTAKLVVVNLVHFTFNHQTPFLFLGGSPRVPTLFLWLLFEIC